MITPFLTEHINILDSYIIDKRSNILVIVKICFFIVSGVLFKCKGFFASEIIVQVLKLIGLNNMKNTTKNINNQKNQHLFYV